MILKLPYKGNFGQNNGISTNTNNDVGLQIKVKGDLFSYFRNRELYNITCRLQNTPIKITRSSL